MAEQDATHKNRFRLRVPLGIGYSDLESVTAHQGGKRNAHQEAGEHSQGVGEEYQLTVDVTLVPSAQNVANRLTRVSQQWFDAMKRSNGPGPLIGAIHVDELDADQIMFIHRNSGYPGV